jgi:acetyl esterase/lipase
MESSFPEDRTMTELVLWPGDEKTPSDEKVRDDDGPKFITSLGRPSLTVYPAASAPGAPTVLVCPGGGYWGLAIEHEGIEIAERLNKEGIHAAVLKYRLPGDHPIRHEFALQDAQRALCLLRIHGAEWRINPGRLGIMGFSAGGHLSALTSNTDHLMRKAGDEGDAAFKRPDFTVLIYPAYLSDLPSGPLPKECPVSAATPPAFLAHTLDDPITHCSSRAYALACQEAGVPAELHLFPSGGHGYGLRTDDPGLKLWPDLLAAWLHRLGRKVG